MFCSGIFIYIFVCVCVLNVTVLNDYAYIVNSLWGHPVSFPFENQEPSSQPGTEWVLEKNHWLNQREWMSGCLPNLNAGCVDLVFSYLSGFSYTGERS